MRIFVAVVLDDAVKNAMRMAQDSQARRCSEVRWVAPALLHLTVKFRGDTSEGRVAGVC